MSLALQNLRNFQNRLTEWKVPDGLPAVTFVVIAHTDKKGQALFGSVTQFADCDVLYMLERAEQANQATLTCVGARDIEEPPPITFEMQKVEIVTAKGKEFNLVVSKEVSLLDQPVGETKQSKQEAKKAAKEVSLDDLAYRMLFGFFRGPQSWTQWSEWFEITKAARGKIGLGPGTFSDVVNRLMEAGRVRKNFEGLYQVVLEAGMEPGAAPAASASASVTSLASTSDFSILGILEVPEVPEVMPTEGGNASKSVVPNEPDFADEVLRHAHAKKKPA